MPENSVTEQVLGPMNGADTLPSSPHHFITLLSKRPPPKERALRSHQFTFALSSPFS